MILTKYRMFIENGYIETLDIEQAKLHGNYVTIEEDIEEDTNNLEQTADDTNTVR